MVAMDDLPLAFFQNEHTRYRKVGIEYLTCIDGNRGLTLTNKYGCFRRQHLYDFLAEFILKFCYSLESVFCPIQRFFASHYIAFLNKGQKVLGGGSLHQ